MRAVALATCCFVVKYLRVGREFGLQTEGTYFDDDFLSELLRSVGSDKR